jgi:lactate dehydrogenase-like 2-hydroxyacid dehydrogenase
MEINDLRDQEIEAGDLLMTNKGKKYLVIIETGGIGWNFLDVENFGFDMENEYQTNGDLKIGAKVSEGEWITSVVKSDKLTLTIGQ